MCRRHLLRGIKRGSKQLSVPLSLQTEQRNSTIPIRQMRALSASSNRQKSQVRKKKERKRKKEGRG
eukprot:m.14285 g.14285  ORF g.14285 m.14285 type:complete len:66 (-) comp7711_c0_seq1:375-572(-)